MRIFLASLARDEHGATTIEFTLVALMFFMLTFGMVEFSYMFWQYNSASKAAQVGARLAAVSDPVCRSTAMAGSCSAAMSRS